MKNIGPRQGGRHGKNSSGRTESIRGGWANLPNGISEIIPAVNVLFGGAGNPGAWRDLPHTTPAVPPSKLSEWAATEGARY
jgi:hypothetical protein